MATPSIRLMYKSCFHSEIIKIFLSLESIFLFVNLTIPSFFQFQAVKRNMHTECKCHGVSGSCTMKTCWRTLPSFRQIGNYIMSRYMKAKSVFPIKGKGKRSTKVVGLSLRMKRKAPKKPRKRDLVYIQPSPNYCERNLSKGSLGTVGRRCNRTSAGEKLFPILSET